MNTMMPIKNIGLTVEWPEVHYETRSDLDTVNGRI